MSKKLNSQEFIEKIVSENTELMEQQIEKFVEILEQNF
jgi:hypothetical protein